MPSSDDKCWCMKCHDFRKVVDAKVVKTSTGKSRLAGKCEKCGTKVSKFIAGAKKGGRSRKSRGGSRKSKK